MPAHTSLSAPSSPLKMLPESEPTSKASAKTLPGQSETTSKASAKTLPEQSEQSEPTVNPNNR